MSDTTAPTSETEAPTPRFDPQAAVAAARREWGWIALSGAASVIAGFVALVYPGATLLAISWIVGVMLLFWGGASIGRAIAVRGERADHGMHALAGAIALFAGAITVAWPGITVLTLVLALSFWWLSAGVTELMLASTRTAHRPQNLILGVLSIVAGLIVVVQPGVGVSTLALLVGIGLMLRGVTELWLANALRTA